MSHVNFIVYVRENLKPDVKTMIAGWNLPEIIKQLNIPVGTITGYGKDVATVTDTTNEVGASIKMVLTQWCVVESFVEVHPKITKHLGPVVKGGN